MGPEALSEIEAMVGGVTGVNGKAGPDLVDLSYSSRFVIYFL
jgi:hypothetical protein